jgi:hypothetical protein
MSNGNSNNGSAAAEFSDADIAALDELEFNLQHQQQGTAEQHQQQNQPPGSKRARVL